MTNNLLVSIVLSVTSAGVLTAIINYFKDRHKDASTAKLTDVQTLQAKLAYVEQVAEYLRRHNDSLQTEYDTAEERNRRMRARISELEDELDKLRRSASETQAQCEKLSRQLHELIAEGENQ